jgi:hypothetical protein
MSDAQTEAEELVNAVLPHAEGMLIAHGEFFPFGGALTVDGELAEISVSEEHRHSPVEVIVEELKSGLRGGAGSKSYRATALVFPIQAELSDGADETEAVAIALDHQANFSVVLIIPYVLSDGAVEFGEAIAQEGEHEIFQAPH